MYTCPGKYYTLLNTALKSAARSVDVTSALTRFQSPPQTRLLVLGQGHAGARGAQLQVQGLLQSVRVVSSDVGLLLQRKNLVFMFFFFFFFFVFRPSGTKRYYIA